MWDPSFMLKSCGWWWWWVVAYRILVSAQGPLVLGFGFLGFWVFGFLGLGPGLDKNIKNFDDVQILWNDPKMYVRIARNIGL